MSVVLRAPRARTWVAHLSSTGQEVARVRASSFEEALGLAIRAVSGSGREAERLVVRPLRGRCSSREALGRELEELQAWCRAENALWGEHVEDDPEEDEPERPVVRALRGRRAMH